MPPKKANKTLSKQQIELIRKWIEQGAEFKGHWAYVKLEKPSVKSEDPESSNAARHPACSVPQKMRVKPARTRASHAAKVAISPSGAYAPMIRSRRSKLIDGGVTNRNAQRSKRNTERVILDAVARGKTTVLTAEPIVAITIATPAITARTRSASTPRW